MKKFFAIYLSILCAFPILANGGVQCSTYDDNRAACLLHGNCYFGEYDGCQECSDTTYNPQQSNCNDEDTDNCDETCQPVPANNFKNSDGTWYLPCPINNKYTYTNTEATYIGNCTCPADTILINTTENSTNSYYCGQCGDGGMQSQSGDIYTCSCQASVGVNNVHGATSSGTRVECACPTGAIWQSGSCKCATNTYLKKNSNNEYVCATCPEHSTSTFGSTNLNDCKCYVNYYMGGTNNTCQSCPEHSSCQHYSGQTYETATCNSGYQKVPNTEEHTFTCQACTDANAELVGDDCICNAGYYGTLNGLNTHCAACPAGATTDNAGATQRSQCKLTQDTKFCYGTGTNNQCMKLLPNGTTIYATNNDTAQNAVAE